VDGIATKCTFCVERIDAGLARGQTPGVDPEATPACVNSCIAGALHFGDAEDPRSNVSQLLAEHQHFRLHEALGTGPRIYYLWDKAP
jgi:phenylacetyl-CoA:acceptor oxidoreductase subunit 1